MGGLERAKKKFAKYIAKHADDFSGCFHEHDSAIEILAVALADKPLSFCPTEEVTNYKKFKKKAEACGLFVARDDTYQMNVVVAKDKNTFDEYVALDYPAGFAVPPEPMRKFALFFANKAGIEDEIRKLIEAEDWKGADSALSPHVLKWVSDPEIAESRKQMNVELSELMPSDAEYKVGILLGYPECDVHDVLWHGYDYGNAITRTYSTLTHIIYNRNGSDDALEELRLQEFRKYLGKSLSKVLE